MKRIVLAGLVLFGIGIAVNAQRPVATRLDTNEHPIVGSAFKATALTVNGGTAQALPNSGLSGRMFVTVYNNGTSLLYLGHPGVTTTNGFPLGAGESINIDLNDSTDIYGISNGTDLNVRTLEG